MERTKKKKLIVGAGLVVVLAGGAATLAVAQSDDGTADLDRAAEAALAEVDAGRVTSVEADDGGYDVEIRHPDGTETDIHLGADFQVVSSDVDGIDRPDQDDDRDGDDRPLDDATRTAAGDAALAAAGDGTVVSVEADDDGGYDVEIRHPDGSETDVDLSADLQVLRTDTDPAGD